MTIHKSSIAIHAAAVVAYAALAVVLLGPLDPGAEIWGNNTTDVYTKLNLRAWQASQAAEGSPFPLRTNHLLYPDGSKLFMADPVGGVLIIPVVWVMGAAAGYNVLVAGNLVFGCWAMFWLVGRRQPRRDRWAALLAGGIYGLSPLALGHINNGVTEIQQIGWLPLFVGALLALYDDAREPSGHRRAGLLALGAAAAWWCCAVASHWYFGMFASGLFVLLLGALAIHAWDRRLILGLALRFAAAGAIFAVLVLPVVLVFLSSMDGEAGITRGLDGENANRMRFRADAAFLFASRAPENADVEVYLHLAYLGFLAPLLAAAGLLRAGSRRVVAACLAAAVLFGLLAFGPDLMVHNHNTDSPLVRALMPYNLVSTVVPFFDSIDFPYRFFLLVHLFVALAAGVGLAGLLPKLRGRGAVYIGGLALVLLEVALLSGVPWPMARQQVSASPAVVALASPAEPRFAVFDLPARFDLSALNRYTVGQVFHGRPSVYCNFPTARFPLARSLARGSLVTNALAVASDGGRGPGASFFQAKAARELQLGSDGEALTRCLIRGACEDRLARELAVDLRRLHAKGITRFVVHHGLLGPRSRVLPLCRALFGPAAARDDAVSVFVLKKGNRFMR